MLQKSNRPINVVIIPGSRHTLKEYWYPQLAKELRGKGLEVLYSKFPILPNQNLDNWNKVLAKHEERLTNKTIYIGHSLGGRFLFNYLQDHKAGAAFFVSTPFEEGIHFWRKQLHPSPEVTYLISHWDELNGTFFKEEIDWVKLLHNIEKVHLFYSTKDYLIPLIHAYDIQKRIGGEIHWVENGRHLDVELKRIPELTKTILRTYDEINATHIEG